MAKSKGRRCGAGFEISSARESLISALVSSGFHHQEFLIREPASYVFLLLRNWKVSLDFFLTFGVAFFFRTHLLIFQTSDVDLRHVLFQSWQVCDR
jgi:hypothetical protein